MIHFLEGNYSDIHEERKKLTKGFSVHSYDSDQINNDLFSQIRTQNMFGEKYVYVLHNAINVGFLTELKKNIETYNKNDNTIIVIENQIKAPEKKIIEKLGIKIKTFKVKEAAKDKRLFTLANYLLDKDKKNAWLYFLEIKKDFSPDEIINILTWGYSTRANVLKGFTKGMHPYALSNMKKKKITFDESIEKAISALELHEKARKDLHGANMLIEEFILN